MLFVCCFEVHIVAFFWLYEQMSTGLVYAHDFAEWLLEKLLFSYFIVNVISFYTAGNLDLIYMRANINILVCHYSAE